MKIYNFFFYISNILYIANRPRAHSYESPLSLIYYTSQQSFVKLKFGSREKARGSRRCNGKFGVGERNERGQRFIEFATKHNMIITNSLFEKRAKAKWTWKSPGDDYRNEIDYILTNKRHN